MILTSHWFKALIVCVPFVLVIRDARNVFGSAGSHGKTLDRHVRESVEETLSAFTVLQRTTV